MTTFRNEIREKIADEALQIALDSNAKRRVEGRISAFQSLPDWQERRQRAHAVRADVIEHLDRHLDKFIAKVTENGIIVHRAKDAAEAIKIFLGIVDANDFAKHLPGTRRWNGTNTDDRSDKNSLLIAKSKSMVTEEI